MVRASKSKILDELNDVTKFRPGFDNLIYYCKTNRYRSSWLVLAWILSSNTF